MLAAVTAYTVSLFLHITAVVIGLGVTFAEAVTFPLAMKLDARHLPFVHRLGLILNQRFASIALLIVLVTGAYQVEEGNWSWGDPWISATFVILIVLGGLIGAVFTPMHRRLGERVTRELADGGAPSDEYQREARRLGAFGGLAGLLVVVAIFLMVTKPGA